MKATDKLLEKSAVAVDMRMVRSSGIGTYLRETVPRVFTDSAHLSALLLGDPELLKEVTTDPVWSPPVISCQAPIYSIREQVEIPLLIPRGTSLLWSPHYNIPIAYRGRLVVTIHDALHLARPEFVQGWHRSLYARTLFSRIRQKALAVLCDSRFTADELRRLVGINDARLHVVHLGVHPKWFAAAGARPSELRPYFIYLGNVKPHKNLVGLVRAFAAVAEEIPHDLVIVGRREGFLTGDKDVEREARRVGDRITFTGELSDTQVIELVSQADALVLPSFYEGFGLPAIEAMAAGCPVLASNAASLPEVCGKGALYFDPSSEVAIAAALKRIARDEPLRRELIEAGSERAREFTWERCARETADVLAHALES